MIDHYEMSHPMADHCPHAGVGKACRPCRQKFRWTADDLRDTPAGRALLAEGWEERHKARPDYSQGHEDDCLGYEDCWCGRYINPYREETSITDLHPRPADATEIPDEMVLAAINADRYEQYRAWGRTVQETHGPAANPTKVDRVDWEPRTSLDQFEPVLVARTRAALSAALAWAP